MAATITHTTVAVGTNAGNGEIRKVQWNESHTLIGTIDVANGGTGAATARAASVALGVPYVLAQSGTAASVGAVITEAALATITVPGGAMGPNGWIVVQVNFSCNNNANNKIMRLRVGGAAGTLFFETTQTTNIFVSRLVHIINNNSQSAQKTSSAFGNVQGYGAGASAPPTATVSTASDWDIVIAGQKAVAGDTLTLDAYQVIVCYGA